MLTNSNFHAPKLQTFTLDTKFEFVSRNIDTRNRYFETYINIQGEGKMVLCK